VIEAREFEEHGGECPETPEARQPAATSEVALGASAAPASVSARALPDEASRVERGLG
jgi:hypothetical protein